MLTASCNFPSKEFFIQEANKFNKNTFSIIMTGEALICKLVVYIPFKKKLIHSKKRCWWKRQSAIKIPSSIWLNFSDVIFATGRWVLSCSKMLPSFHSANWMQFEIWIHFFQASIHLYMHCLASLKEAVMHQITLIPKMIEWLYLMLQLLFAFSKNAALFWLL